MKSSGGLRKTMLRNSMPPHVFPAKIVTQIVPLKAFYNGEEYHQDYADKNPNQSLYSGVRCAEDGSAQSAVSRTLSGVSRALIGVARMFLLLAPPSAGMRHRSGGGAGWDCWIQSKELPTTVLPVSREESKSAGANAQVTGGLMQALEEHPGGLAGVLDHFRKQWDGRPGAGLGKRIAAHGDA